MSEREMDRPGITARASDESPANALQRWLAALRRQQQAGILDPALAGLIPHLERGLATTMPAPAGPIPDLGSAGPEEVREQIITALYLTQDLLFHRVGYYPAELMIAARCFEDVQRGIDNSPIMRATRRAKNRFQDPSLVWEARALLVVAVEVLMALGDPPKGAARRVGRDAKHWIPTKLRPDKALLAWREQFAKRRAPYDKKHPHGGEHWAVLEEYGAHIKVLQGREAELTAFYDRVLRHARLINAGNTVAALSPPLNA